MKRRREAIARMLEESPAYRLIQGDGAPKLSDTKFVGPIVYRGLGFGPPETVYCVRAKVEYGYLPAFRFTVIEVELAEKGAEHIRAETTVDQHSYACAPARFGPFPELERLRNERRRAMGLPL